MKALNFIFYLFVSIFVIAIVSGQNTCTFTDSNRTIQFSGAFNYSYIMNLYYSTGTSYSISTLFKIQNATYFPTYISWTCNPPGTGYFRVQYYTLSSSNSCSVLKTSNDNFAITGYVSTDSGQQIGNWVYYIWAPDMGALYTMYTDYPSGKTIYYKTINAFPLNDYYCSYYASDHVGIVFTLYSPIPSMLNNFYFYYQTSATTNILIAYPRASTTAANYTCNFYMRYISLYIINYLSVNYIKDLKLLNVSILTTFDGYIKLYGQRDFTASFSKNQLFNSLIPYINDTIYIYDSNNYLIMVYNLKPYMSCLDEPDTGVYTLKLKDLAGNQILKYKIIYNGNEYSDDNGIITVPLIYNANITVLPFYRPDLAFNTTITVNQPGITYITAPIYVYTIKIKALYIPIIGGEMPIGFSYIFNGQEYADKVNLTNGNIAIGGTGYDNVTIQLLAGNYQLTLKTSLSYLGADLITKQIDYNLSLFDNNYFRELTWYTSLSGDSINQNALNMPVLSITVIDQNSKPVANAYIYLNDTNGTNMGIKPTDQNGNAVFYVQSGQTYTINVYYTNVLKATKIISYPPNEMVVQVTFQIYIESQNQSGIGTGTGETGAENITAISTWAVGIMVNPIVIALFIILLLAGTVAKIGGPEIGIVAMISCIGIFTFIVPVLPVQILGVIGVAAGVLFGLRLVRK
jgi:hypothetical protein